MTRLGIPAIARIPRREQPMRPEEEESLLASIGRPLLGGLSRVANVLDLPGSMVRDVIGGENPFDQWLTPTRFENRTTGRELLRKGGLIGEENTAGNFMGGLGVEILLDPLFFGAGAARALTKGGEVLAKTGLRKFVPEVAQAIAKKAGTKAVGKRIAGHRMTLADLLKNLPPAIRKGEIKKAAKVAKNLGTSLRQVKNQPLTGLGALEVPFTNLRKTFGAADELTGDLAERLAAPLTKGERLAAGQDVLGAAIAGAPGVRNVYAMFSQAPMGAVTKPGQDAATKAFHELEIVKPREMEEIGREFHNIADTGLLAEGRAGEEALETMRDYVEGVGELPNTPAWQKTKSSLDKIHTRLGTILKEERALGMETREFKGWFNYFTRQKHTFETNMSHSSSRTMKESHQMQIARKAMFDDIRTSLINKMSLDHAISATLTRRELISGKDPVSQFLRTQANVTLMPRLSKGRRRTLMKQLQEYGFSEKRAADEIKALFPPRTARGVDLKAARQHIYENYLTDAERANMLDRLVNVKGLDPEDAAKAVEDAFSTAQVDALADWLSKLDVQHLTTGVPVFGHHPMVDYAARVQASLHARASVNATYGLLADNAAYVDRASALPGEGFVPLKEFLAGRKLDPEIAAYQIYNRLPDQVKASIGPTAYSVPTQEILEKVQRSGINPPTMGSGNNFRMLDPEWLAKNLSVPHELAADSGRFMDAFSQPKSIGTFVNGWMKFTDWFRADVTTYFPAFIVRNLTSGQLQNYIGGVYGKNPLEMVARSIDAHTLIKGKTIKGLAESPVFKSMKREVWDEQLGRRVTRKFTDEDATEWLAEQVFAHQLGGRLQTEFGQAAGSEAYGRLADFMGEMPGVEKFSWRKTFKKLVDFSEPGALNPTAVRGLGSRQQSQFALSKWGEDMGYWVEAMNRIAPFISLIKKGWDPAEAARRIKLLQVDYRSGAAGDVVMRQLIPFWAFAKNQAVFVAKELAERPGGPLAQTMRLQSTGTRAAPQLIPEWMQEGLAIQVSEGDPEKGTGPTILGQFGLMHEDPLSFLKGEGVWGTAKGFAGELLGRSNPLIQEGLKLGLGVAPGMPGPRGGSRAVADMDPVGGRILANVLGREDAVKLPEASELALRLTLPRISTTAKHLTSMLTHFYGDAEYKKPILGTVANVTTGMRVVNVPPRIQEGILGDIIQTEAMKVGGRVFEKPYIPVEAQIAADPQTRAEQERVIQMGNILARRRKKRVKEAGGRPDAPPPPRNWLQMLEIGQ